MGSNIAIILSGGIGARMDHNIPKQYIHVCGKPIIAYCLECFIKNDRIDAIIIVLDKQWLKEINPYVENASMPIYYSEPGETRQYSIYNALKKAKQNNYSDEDIVVIHDAARPLITDKLLNACIDGCENYEGVMPVLPMKDTIYQSLDGCCLTSLLDRNSLFAGQAPEAFKLGKYMNAHDSMTYNELSQINGSTELAYKAGMRIKIIDGNDMNFKITTKEDLVRFELIMQGKE